MELSTGNKEDVSPSVSKRFYRIIFLAFVLFSLISGFKVAIYSGNIGTTEYLNYAVVAVGKFIKSGNDWGNDLLKETNITGSMPVAKGMKSGNDWGHDLLNVTHCPTPASPEVIQKAIHLLLEDFKGIKSRVREPKTQKTRMINFLDNYKNPCWVEELPTKSFNYIH